MDSWWHCRLSLLTTSGDLRRLRKIFLASCKLVAGSQQVRKKKFLLLLLMKSNLLLAAFLLLARLLSGLVGFQHEGQFLVSLVFGLSGVWLTSSYSLFLVFGVAFIRNPIGLSRWAIIIMVDVCSSRRPLPHTLTHTQHSYTPITYYYFIFRIG